MTSSERQVSGAAIHVEGLTKAYGGGATGLLALDGIDLTVARGEFLAVLGPSGCGKSTLLHAIAGLAEASGTLRVHGNPVAGPGPDRGVVFQDYALFPWRTVAGNVAFGLELQGVARAARERTAREYISLVGLSGFEDRYPVQLSGGMKQRVAIARALACDPEVLLLDEPFAALDAQTRETLQGELLRIWEATGKTVVFVTHSIDEAVFLAQRVAVMTARPGRIKAVVEVDLAAGRDQGDVRSTPEFAAARHRLWELLSVEVREAREQASRADHGHAPSPRRSLWAGLRRALSRGPA